MFLRNRTIALAASVLAACSWTLAEAKEGQADPPNAEAPGKAKGRETPPPAKVTPQQVAGWIQELDADSSRVRDRATKDLIRAGKAAVEPAAQAAKGTSLEVTTRCIEILKSLLASEDAATKEAAKAALEKLAADKKHEAGSLAQGVLDAAKPRPQTVEDRLRALIRAQQIAIGARAGIQIAPGNIAVQIAVGDAGGQREVSVRENGRKIQIRENNKEIVVTVTEPGKDKAAGGGKEQPKPKVYKAANAAELKKKHPEAYKLYLKYAAKNRAAAVMIGNIGLAPALGQARAREIPARRGNTVQVRRLIAEARQELRKSIDRLKAAREGKLDARALDRILKDIEAAEKKLAEAQKGLAQ